MLLNLSELFSVKGKEKTYTLDVTMDEYSASEAVYPIVLKHPVNLRLQNLGEKKLLLTGTAGVTLSIPCDRCLEPISYPIEVNFNEELDLGRTEAERAELLDEQPYIKGYNLDVDQLLSNELLLNLPMKILCSENCRGICNRCGANFNQGTCSCDQSSPDPRMSRIQDLFQQFKEV
ncbi:MAG: YceD family protein [Lachnospiraceae bacterium]